MQGRKSGETKLLKDETPDAGIHIFCVPHLTIQTPTSISCSLLSSSSSSSSFSCDHLPRPVLLSHDFDMKGEKDVSSGTPGIVNATLSLTTGYTSCIKHDATR